MTAPASQRLLVGPWWRRILKICPVWRVLWTRHCNVSIAWTYLRHMSISTPLSDRCRLAAAPRRQTAQAKLDQIVWADLEDTGYER